MRRSYRTIEDYLIMLWHDRRAFFAAFVLLAIAGALASSQVAPTYTAKATLIYAGPDLDLNAKNNPPARSDIAGQIFASGARVLTLDNLRGIAKRYLVNRTADKSALDDAAMGLASGVHVDLIQSEPGKAESTVGFTVAYANRRASVAKSVVNDIASLYLRDGSQEGKRGTTVAHTLLQDEAKTLQDKITGLDQAIAQFKHANARDLPELHEYNLRSLSMQKEELADLQRQIRDREEQSRQNAADLAAANPYSYIYTEDGKRLYTPKEQLELLRAEYAEKASHYAPDHPDMIAIKRRLAALEAVVAGKQLADTDLRTAMTAAELRRSMHSVNGSATATAKFDTQRAGASALAASTAPAPLGRRNGNADGKAKPAVVSDNPIFLRLLSEKNSLQREIATMRSSETDGKKKISEYERLLSREPEVARQLGTLVREYDDAEKRLTDIREREFNSRLDLAVANNGAGSRYMLAEATRVPDVADTRKRTTVAILSALVSLVVSVGVVLFRGIKKHVIFDMKGLIQVAGSQTIVAIPGYTRALAIDGMGAGATRQARSGSR